MRSGRLERQTPVTLAEAATRLAAETGVDSEVCRAHLQQLLLAGNAAIDPGTGRPAFNFRLHQFVSRGDTVYASLEEPRDRFLTMEGQVYVPGDREKRLFPLAFCRECGQDYAVVDRPRHDGVPEERVEPREFDDAAPADSRDRQSGYLYLDPGDVVGPGRARRAVPRALAGDREGRVPSAQIALQEAGAGEDRRPARRHDRCGSPAPTRSSPGSSRPASASASTAG